MVFSTQFLDLLGVIFCVDNLFHFFLRECGLDGTKAVEEGAKGSVLGFLVFLDGALIDRGLEIEFDLSVALFLKFLIDVLDKVLDPTQICMIHIKAFQIQSQWLLLEILHKSGVEIE